MIRVYVGFDPREVRAYQVTVRSLLSRASLPLAVEPLLLPHLEAVGLYRRETIRTADGGLMDKISGAPMSTEFALSRFLVPRLAGEVGCAVFMDADFLWRDDIRHMLAAIDWTKAVSVVKHAYEPAETVKMDGQPQTSYPRKNWSSLMVFNLGHPAHRHLTDVAFASRLGRDLHALNWLRDEVIGDIDPRWNHLVGVDAHDPAAGAVHFTLGTPDMPGYEDQPFASEWWAYAPLDVRTATH